MKSAIVILCLLGDPSLPAASCDRTGGFNVDMSEILKYWSSFSYPIIVITNSSLYIEKNFEQLYDNIQICRVTLEDDILNSQPQLAEKFPRILQETINCIEYLNIHPVFFHSYYWYSGLLALNLSQKYNVKFIHSVVALSIDKKLSNSSNFCTVQYEYENAFLTSATFILAISNAEKQTLIKHYECSEEKIMVVGRSVDCAFLLPDHDNKGISNSLIQNNEQKWKLYLESFVPDRWWYHGAFTYIGRIKFEKGVGIIIEAWFQLYLKYKNKIPPLWIVGGQPDTIIPFRDKMVTIHPEIVELEKEMKICWWGYLTPASINAVFLKTAVVVTHSQYEAGGRVIIESLSAGRPVIASPTGFACDLIRDWKNGFLVPFGNIALLKHRMEHFIRQPFITNPLGEYARFSFQNAFMSWNYYEKHRYVYDYLYHHKNTTANTDEDQNLKQIPDYYQKKLLYAWPDSKEVEKKIKAWCFKNISDKILSIKYCTDLSHHSFVWEIELQEKHYFIKHLYTIFNEDLLWNTDNSLPDIIHASELFAISTIVSPVTLEIKWKNRQLFSIITEKTDKLSPKQFLDNYKSILKVIYQFDKTFPDEQLSFDILTFSYEQMVNSIFENSLIDSEVFKDIKDVLEKEKFQDISISYGKAFFSHMLHTDDGYRLLPTASIYKAPTGTDAAVFLIELLTEFYQILNSEKFYQIIEDASIIFKVTKLRLYNLCLVIILMKTQKQQYLKSTKDMPEEYFFLISMLKFIS